MLVGCWQPPATPPPLETTTLAPVMGAAVVLEVVVVVAVAGVVVVDDDGVVEADCRSCGCCWPYNELDRRLPSRALWWLGRTKAMVMMVFAIRFSVVGEVSNSIKIE